MTALKVLSLHQPWAAFVVAGMKRFETRPGPPNGDMRPEGVPAGVTGCALNRGDVLGIASTQKILSGLADVYTQEHDRLTGRCARRHSIRMPNGELIAAPAPGSLSHHRGHLLGTVRVVGAHPIIDAERGWHLDLDTPATAVILDNLRDDLYLSDHGGRVDLLDREWDLGDWTPGRWAIELDEPTLTTARCPWPACSHGSVPAADPDRPDMRGARSDLHPAGEPLDPCPICDGDEVCLPIPVTGRQGVWAWTGEVRPT